MRNGLIPALSNARMQSNSKTIIVRERRFGYEVAGSANEAVMFVHGSGFSGAMWMPFARSLEPRMRSILVDLLGYGHSAHIRKGDVVGPTYVFYKWHAGTYAQQ